MSTAPPGSSSVILCGACHTRLVLHTSVRRAMSVRFQARCGVRRVPGTARCGEACHESTTPTQSLAPGKHAPRSGKLLALSVPPA
jgi:hypothetical protein